MLKFNTEHKSIDGNINKNIAKKVSTIVLVASLSISSMMIFSGCAKNVPCDVKELHAHVYSSENNIKKYIMSEKEYIGDFNRTEEYIIVEDKEKEIINFENKKNLIKIAENKKVLEKQIENYKDYLEYQYAYTYFSYIYTGKTLIPIAHTGYGWTDNPKHSRLTGETRIVHYVYYGYNIAKDEKGKLIIVRSNPVDNINDLIGNYEYMKYNDLFEKVNLENKEELDYEGDNNKESDNNEKSHQKQKTK